MPFPGMLLIVLMVLIKSLDSFLKMGNCKRRSCKALLRILYWLPKGGEKWTVKVRINNPF